MVCVAAVISLVIMPVPAAMRGLLLDLLPRLLQLRLLQLLLRLLWLPLTSPSPIHLALPLPLLWLTWRCQTRSSSRLHLTSTPMLLAWMRWLLGMRRLFGLLRSSLLRVPLVAVANVSAVLFLPAPPPPPESVDIDLSAEEGPSHRLFKTYREVWDDKLSWEEIRARKLRLRVSIPSQDPSSTPVLFPSPSPSSSLSTPVAQATPVPSPFSSDGSIVDSVRSPTPPCLRDVSRHAVCHPEDDSGEASDVRFDFGPLTRHVLESGLCVDVFRMNYYLSHPECRAHYSLPDADHPVLPDVPPSLFVSR